MPVGLMQDNKAYPASRLTSEARKPRTCTHQADHAFDAGGLAEVHSIRELSPGRGISWHMIFSHLGYFSRDFKSRILTMGTGRGERTEPLRLEVMNEHPTRA